MTALAANRDTPRRTTDMTAARVKSATTIYSGSLVVLVAGYAEPGSTAPGLHVLGRAAQMVVNAGDNGAAHVNVEAGTFRWANADAITVADIGKPAFIVDDQTVSKDGTGKSLAGIIADVDDTGVWVRTTPDAVALKVAP
jgi:hypothetical protein